MPEILEALILGIVQGLTEFLPVSSSGHLEIFKVLLKDDSLAEQSMLTTVFLHFATALATMFVFRKDILTIIKASFSSDKTSDKRFPLYIIVSMVPAVLIGLLFEDKIESFFSRNLLLVGVALLFTAVLLLISESVYSGKKYINSKNAFLIGIAQAIAILPGVSRSGATIASSMMLGLNKDDAARFSFLMVVPLIFGKMAKDLISGDFASNSPDILYLAVGFLAAFLSGVWACKFMIKIVRAAKLNWFAFYCVIVGLISIFVSF